jgi:hypothetical protein
VVYNSSTNSWSNFRWRNINMCRIYNSCFY